MDASATPSTKSDDVSEAQPTTPATGREISPELRAIAILEVVLCSGFPTQVLLGKLFARFGLVPEGLGNLLDIRFVAPILLADTALLIGLIVLILKGHRERPWDLLFGQRPWRHELRAAVPMVFQAYGIALSVLLTVAIVAPWLRTVEQNPLQNLLRQPADAAMFALIVILAGGVREEVQRAFVLTRFEQSLGGPTVGLVVSSVAFGAGHLIQGADAAMATGVLGAFWGFIYLRRRSVVAPVVSHAAFDVLQIGIFLLSGR